MSTINEMSIKGIRSFGPEEHDKQSIVFYTPLTLILGPNGTGKTTIIECLKYMTTGALPPGCARNGAFIHDPKVAGKGEVEGEICLSFNDTSKKSVTTQRYITATQKKNKVEMKTQYITIKRQNEAGEEQSNTIRSADLHRVMITCLGVSKPVLENVIFCHQEDTNWPLSEGKQLKEKFDALFASTRYVKALENIKEIRKKQDEKVKYYELQIQLLKQNKDKALKEQDNLTDRQNNLAESKQLVENVTEQLKPIEEKMKEIAKKCAEIDALKREITILERENSLNRKHAEELQDQIENTFNGSDNKLKKMLDKLMKRPESLHEFQDRQTELNKQLEKLRARKSDIALEVGGLKQEAKQHEENVRERDNLTRQYAEEYSFEDYHGDITNDKCKRFLDQAQAKLNTMANDSKTEKAKYENQEKEMQSKIDKLRETKAMLEQNKQNKSDMMEKNKRQIKEINNTLNDVETCGDRTEQIRQQLKKHEHDLQTEESNVNVEEFKQEITQISKDKSTIDNELSELNTEIIRLHQQSSAQAELDMLKKDKEENIRRIEARHKDTVKYLLGHGPSKNVGRELKIYIRSQTDEVKKYSAQINQFKIKLSETETERKMVVDQLKKKEEELKGLQERMYNECGSQNLDEALSTTQDKMEKARDQLGSLQGDQRFFKKYAKVLGKEPCCPLCHRDFNSDKEVSKLVDDLNKDVDKFPSKLEGANEKMEEYQQKYEKLSQLKPLRENMVVLEEKEIPQMKRSIENYQDDICKLKDQVSNIKEELRVNEQDEGLAKQIQSDIIKLEVLFLDVTDLDERMNLKASELSGVGKTLQAVIDEKEDLQMKVDSMTKQLDYKRQELADHSEHVQILRATINSLKEEKLDIKIDLLLRCKLEEKANREADDEVYEKDIRELASKIHPLQSQINQLMLNKEEIVKRKEEKIEHAKSGIDDVNNKVKKVENFNKGIEIYYQSRKAVRLDEILKNKDETDRELNKVTKVRELEKNLNLRNKKANIENIITKVDDLNEKLGKLNADDLEREYRKLKNEFENLKKERDKATGRQTELDSRIQCIEEELQLDMYREAEKDHIDMIIDIRTTKHASGDLIKYYGALDRAIMKYHKMKMSEINKFIRNLWRQTYKGHDIDAIEIRSDEDESDTKMERKTYNYRVVMIKPGDVVIDMRNRCSSGQKVLASLIIRLALAEIFCLNCGILALDEPTTNLDRENIESFASGLVEIIKGRMHQKNFQLVIITHDEEFVELLGRSEYVEEFFKVSKNEKGYSQLTKTKVSELHR